MDISKGLTHAMDVFSLGCVLVELFTEGRFYFTYERIIRYKFVFHSIFVFLRDISIVWSDIGFVFSL